MSRRTLIKSFFALISRNPNGGSIKKMDDPSGYCMDSSIYGDKFRFFSIFVGAEGGSRGVTDATELFSDGVGPWQGVWVVVGVGLDVFAVVGGDAHCCLHGTSWLRNPMACDSGIYHLALFCGKFFLFIFSQYSCTGTLGIYGFKFSKSSKIVNRYA